MVCGGVGVLPSGSRPRAALNAVQSGQVLTERSVCPDLVGSASQGCNVLDARHLTRPFLPSLPDKDTTGSSRWSSLLLGVRRPAPTTRQEEPLDTTVENQAVLDHDEAPAIVRVRLSARERLARWVTLGQSSSHCSYACVHMSASL